MAPWITAGDLVVLQPEFDASDGGRFVIAAKDVWTDLYGRWDDPVLALRYANARQVVDGFIGDLRVTARFPPSKSVKAQIALLEPHPMKSGNSVRRSRAFGFLGGSWNSTFFWPQIQSFGRRLMMISSGKRRRANATGDSSSQLTSNFTEVNYPTISPTSMMWEIAGDDTLSPSVREYFEARLRHRLYDLVISVFIASGQTRSQLAKRVGKRPEQITRWLSGPGNLTLDTASDLLLGICGAELAMKLEYPANKTQQAPRYPEALLKATHRSRQRASFYQTNVSVGDSRMKTVADSKAVFAVTTLASGQLAFVEMS